MTADEYRRLPLSTRLGHAADSSSDREAEWEADALALEQRLDRAMVLLREWASSDEENRWDVTVRTRALLSEAK